MAKSTVRVMVLIAATLVTSVAFAARGTYDRQLTAPPGGRLTFDTDIGSVTVVGRPISDVVIHANLHGSKSFLRRIRIHAADTSSGVTVSVHAASGGWFHWFNFGWHRVRFTVQVPRDYPAEVHTSGGDLAVQNLNASVHGSTSGGDAVVRQITGTVDIHTSGGGINAQQLNGPAQLSTSGGDLHIQDSTGDLTLLTSGGDIRMRNDEGSVNARTSGGDIWAQLRANRGIRLETGGGDITLLLPKSMHASIKASSSGGDITTDFPLSTTEILSGHYLQGDIGGGGAPISLHSSGGDIHIEPVQ